MTKGGGGLQLGPKLTIMIQALYTVTNVIFKSSFTTSVEITSFPLKERRKKLQLVSIFSYILLKIYVIEFL